MSSATTARCYCATSATDPLTPWVVPRRPIQPLDVSIQIHYCGICHSDLHHIRSEWKKTNYPIVPGHEIVGVVEAVGSEVTKFKIGDRVGVGCMVNSCRSCDSCKQGDEQYCSKSTMTYGVPDTIGNLPESAGASPVTYGGYSERVLVQEPYVLSIPDNLDFAAAAPLLCAGITVWTPIVEASAGPGKKIGVLGVGGLGHMAIKIAHAFGAHVVAFTSKAEKRDELIDLGASQVIVTSDEESLASVANSLDILIDTVSADHPLMPMLNTLKFGATYHLLGASPTNLSFNAFAFLRKRIHLTGSLIGGIQKTQDMLDFCGKHNITAIIELLPFNQINEAIARLEKGDVRYRFVLDIQSEYKSG